MLSAPGNYDYSIPPPFVRVSVSEELSEILKFTNVQRKPLLLTPEILETRQSSDSDLHRVLSDKQLPLSVFCFRFPSISLHPSIHPSIYLPLSLSLTRTRIRHASEKIKRFSFFSWPSFYRKHAQHEFSCSQPGQTSMPVANVSRCRKRDSVVSQPRVNENYRLWPAARRWTEPSSSSSTKLTHTHLLWRHL